MNRVNITPGDQIFYSCGTHQHHEIYCGDIPYGNRTYHDVVIHFEGQFKRRQIRGVSLEKFAQGREISLVPYKEGSCFYRSVVIERAISKLGEPDYNLFGNNCEHFAHWCKTGRKRCGQVHNLIEEAGGIVGSAIVGGVTGAIIPLAIPEVVIIGVCLAAGYAGRELGKIGANFISDRPDYNPRDIPFS